MGLWMLQVNSQLISHFTSGWMGALIILLFYWLTKFIPPVVLLLYPMPSFNTSHQSNIQNLHGCESIKKWLKAEMAQML